VTAKYSSGRFITLESKVDSLLIRMRTRECASCPTGQLFDFACAT
jgi:hypothetical protein